MYTQQNGFVVPMHMCLIIPTCDIILVQWDIEVIILQLHSSSGVVKEWPCKREGGGGGERGGGEGERERERERER